jgi:hypothetical protein
MRAGWNVDVQPAGEELVMWVFCCLALIVNLILALSPDPDRAHVACTLEDRRVAP